MNGDCSRDHIASIGSIVLSSIFVPLLSSGRLGEAPERISILMLLHDSVVSVCSSTKRHSWFGVGPICDVKILRDV